MLDELFLFFFTTFDFLPGLNRLQIFPVTPVFSLSLTLTLFRYSFDGEFWSKSFCTVSVASISSTISESSSLFSSPIWSLSSLLFINDLVNPEKTPLIAVCAGFLDLSNWNSRIFSFVSLCINSLDSASSFCSSTALCCFKLFICRFIPDSCSLESIEVVFFFKESISLSRPLIISSNSKTLSCDILPSFLALSSCLLRSFLSLSKVM